MFIARGVPAHRQDCRFRAVRIFSDANSGHRKSRTQALPARPAILPVPPTPVSVSRAARLRLMPRWVRAKDVVGDDILECWFTPCCVCMRPAACSAAEQFAHAPGAGVITRIAFNLVAVEIDSPC